MSFQNPLLAPRSGVWVNDPRKAVGPLFSTSSINDGAAYITSTGELAATDTRIRQHRSRLAITPCARPRHPATRLPCAAPGVKCAALASALPAIMASGLFVFFFLVFARGAFLVFPLRQLPTPRRPPSSGPNPLFRAGNPVLGHFWRVSSSPTLSGPLRAGLSRGLACHVHLIPFESSVHCNVPLWNLPRKGLMTFTEAP